MRFSPLFIAIIYIVACNFAFGQESPAISRVDISSAKQNQPLSFRVMLNQSATINRVVLSYRPFGATEFVEQEMRRSGGQASLILPAEVIQPPFIEYYLRVQHENGSVEIYPLHSSPSNPERIIVAQENPKNQEVRILSPEPGEIVALEDLAVMVSLFYVSDAVDPKATRLFLDGVDVTRNAVLSEDVILYTPKNFPRSLNLGVHFIRVELRDTTGKLYHSIESNFTLSTAQMIAERKAALQLGVTGHLEYRNEDVGGTTTTYARGQLRSSASYQSVNVSAFANIDNQDKPNRQPQNRYLLSGEMSFLRLQYGDAYPQFPSLVLSGKRVRGLNVNLALGFFNLDVATGETKRAIQGTVTKDTVFADSSSVNARPKNSIQKGSNYFSYTIFDPGTYKQNITAVRPSFGSGENFQLGFTYMKVKDDVGSVTYGILPAENLVVGTDLMFAFDDQRFKFETQAALSLENKDYHRDGKGNFTEAEYDSLFKDNAAGKSAAKLAENVITVNENLFPSNPVGSGLPGVSFDAALTMNYFNNFLLAQFFRRGAAYKSFGNEFMQTDLQGFSVSDRVRLFSNKVFLSVAYEKKNDNTADTKNATTTFANLNTSVTVNPGAGFPNVTIGYGRGTRESDLFGRRVDFNISSDSSISETRKSADDVTTRLFLGSSYDFSTTGIRHFASLSVSSNQRADQTFYKRDQKNLTIQTSVTSTFSTLPLQTTIGFGISRNENQNQLFTSNGRDSTLDVRPFNFMTVSFGGQYRLLNDALRLVAALAPSFGDLQRTTLQVGAEYEVIRNHRLEFSLGYNSNSGMPNDLITSFFYRFNF
jgi:hypothetical protein